MDQIPGVKQQREERSQADVADLHADRALDLLAKTKVESGPGAKCLHDGAERPVLDVEVHARGREHDFEALQPYGLWTRDRSARGRPREQTRTFGHGDA